MDFDCIVVGGGPAGLSAALLLGRARRRAVVLDSNHPRNHAARAMHGVLGHDGLDPRELRARGIREIARYGIELRETEPAEARLVEGGVEIDGITARTAILATGLLDDTLDIEGFDAIYGVSAHTCPYCDGWEHQDCRIAVLADGDEVEHYARLLGQWSSDVVAVPPEQVARLHSDDGRLTAIERTDGTHLERDALFFHVGSRPRTALARKLGCALDDQGYIATDGDRRTTVDRVFAAGNCADPIVNVTMAMADGARAGIAVNLRLLDA
jgi:thioredoxin reductase